ncbi:ABC transporter ATP-binding protein [Jiangella alba]|uniref:ATP-binding cassette, subfamily B n=1 Tax=Jiangella alba TaxID=561176 RepID=A0A1H5PUG3_9ACTN|nr:ABC transporter ATP-binding protein [Jiangella alba]SEF17500.1 ATP-binding cassette, subfamily B [Jiangella alba]
MAARRADLRSALPGLRRTLRYLRPHLRPERWLLAGGFGCLLAEVAFRLIEPWPLKYVIDAVIEPGAADRSGIVALLLLCAVALVAAAGLRALSAYLMTVCFALAGTRAMTAVRADVFAHVQRLSLRFHGSTKTGDLLTRLVGDVGRLQEVAVTAALPLLGNVVALLGMTAVMVVLDWRLALIVVAAFPVFVLASSRSSRKITSAARLQRRREGELAGTAGETLGAITVVQAYSLERILQRVFGADNQRALRDGVKASRLAAGLERKTDLLVGVATAAVLLVGGTRVLDGALTPGELVVFVSYLKGAFKPMRDLAKYTGRLAKAAASGERIVDLLETVPDITDAPHARPAPRFRGELRFEQVDLDYGTGERALRDVSLRIPAGCRVGLVGPSGSGKSTLAALVLRLYDPTGGAVTIDGHDLRDLTLASVRGQVAVVLQESVLFATSVRENIRYGRPDATDAEVEAAARVAHADEFVRRLEYGYDTVLGERGTGLSGGQRQRVAVARAVLRDARIVVLDEAATGLDRESSAAVRDAIRALTRGRTTLVISHVPEEVADCDVVVRLEAGRVVEYRPRALPRRGETVDARRR